MEVFTQLHSFFKKIIYSKSMPRPSKHFLHLAKTRVPSDAKSLIKIGGRFDFCQLGKCGSQNRCFYSYTISRLKMCIVQMYAIFRSIFRRHFTLRMMKVAYKSTVDLSFTNYLSKINLNWYFHSWAKKWTPCI